ncbi:hypothetical protein [Aquimarina aquimarini]|uniref:hypothetical protein n=1 Tax=Aquimarina aquimarini TaxID=1191734 RepID=UPI000D54B88D|nr:hypothetical protein [Aquimarina aquimarini]
MILSKLYNSSIFTSWISQLIKVVFSLVTLPIVLKQFSVEQVNVWFLFITIVGIGQGIQYGFNTTFVRFFSYSFSGVRIKEFFDIKNKLEASLSKDVDKQEFSDLYVVLKRTFLFLTLIYFFLLAVFGTWGVIKPIGFLENYQEGWIAWLVIILSTSINLYMSIYQIYLRGINKVALINRVITIVSFFGIFLILFVGIYFPSLLNIILVVQFIAIMNSLCLYFASQKSNDSFLQKIPKSFFKKEVFNEVWDSAWKSGLTTIFATVIKHISGVIVAQLFTPISSASFLLTKRLFELLESFTMVTFQAKIPEIAAFRGRGDFKKLIPLLKKVLYLSYGIFVIGIVVILFFGENLISIIKGNAELGGISLLLAFTYSTLISRWAGINLAISNQANNVIEHINASIVFVIYFLFLGLLYKELGIVVFPLAALVSTLATAPFIIKRTYKTLNTTFIEFEKYMFIPIIIIVSLISLVYISIEI